MPTEHEIVADMHKVEAEARELYEASRKIVAGRPVWEKLDPLCPYDMGMRKVAIAKAWQARAALPHP